MSSEERWCLMDRSDLERDEVEEHKPEEELQGSPQEDPEQVRIHEADAGELDGASDYAQWALGHSEGRILIATVDVTSVGSETSTAS